MINRRGFEINTAGYIPFCTVQQKGVMHMRSVKEVGCFPYSSKRVCYHFIVIATDEMLDEGDPVLHEEQLEWIDARLAEAAASGKPVFVVGHEPIYFGGRFTDEYILSDGTPAGLERIIQKYTNAGTVVLFVGGHRHDLMTEECFMNPSENFYCINLPTSTKNDEDADRNGDAAALEVYDDRMIIRPRNYISGQWYDYQFDVPLT